MPIGIITASSSVLLGSLAGAAIGKLMPERLKQGLPLTFSMCAMSIGISLIPGASSLSAVFLALILGTAVGEGIRLDETIGTAVIWAQKRLNNAAAGGSSSAAEIMPLIVLFCFGATTILGALTEGISGDANILIVKSILDFFTAAIFASALGAQVALIAIPEALLCLVLYFCASFIMPLTQDFMLADFRACGGIITFSVGFKMMGLKDIKSMNMVPAFLLIMPVSWFWGTFIAG